MRVAICEQGTFGGTCLNVGCIPTKMFVYAAEVAETIRHSSRYGVDATHRRGPLVRHRVARVRPHRPDRGGRRAVQARRCPTSRCTRSHTRFGPTQPDGRYTLRTEAGDEFTADQVVIAAGSRIHVPPAIAECGVDVLHQRRRHADPRTARAPGDRRRRLRRRGVRARLLRAGRARHDRRPRRTVCSPTATRRSAIAFTDIARRQVGSAHARERDRRRTTTATGIVLELDDGKTIDGRHAAGGHRPGSQRRPARRRAGRRRGRRRRHGGRRRVPTHHRARHLRARRRVVGVSAQARRQPRDAGGAAQPAAATGTTPPSMVASDHRFVPSAVFTDPQIAMVGHDRGRGQRAAGIDVVTKVQKLRRHRLRLGDGGHHRDREADRRPRAPGKILGAHVMGLPGVVDHPAGDPGDELRSDRPGDGPRPVLDPPGAARGHRERAAGPRGS